MRAEGAVNPTSWAPPGEPDSVPGPGHRAGPAGDRAAVAVELASVSHSFGPLAVLDRIELAVRARELVAIVGPSGCGKSTLLELVAGLRQPTAGRIEVDGACGGQGRLEGWAYMPQGDLLLPWLSAVDNASLALRNRGASRAAARRDAHPLFERFGLAGFERT